MYLLISKRSSPQYIYILFPPFHRVSSFPLPPQNPREVRQAAPRSRGTAAMAVGYAWILSRTVFLCSWFDAIVIDPSLVNFSKNKRISKGKKGGKKKMYALSTLYTFEFSFRCVSELVRSLFGLNFWYFLVWIRSPRRTGTISRRRQFLLLRTLGRLSSPGPRVPRLDRHFFVLVLCKYVMV